LGVGYEFAYAESHGKEVYFLSYPGDAALGYTIGE